MTSHTVDIASVVGAIFPRVILPNAKEHFMATQCCVCERIKHGERWIRPEGELGSLVSHGYCPECHEQACVDVAEWKSIAQNGSLVSRQ